MSPLKDAVLNPATLLLSPSDGEEHNGVDVLQQVCSPRPNLKKNNPLTYQNLALFVDGSASYDHVTGQNNVGFAVV